MKKIDLGQI